MKLKDLIQIFFKFKDTKDKRDFNKRLKSLEEKHKSKTWIQREIEKNKKWLYED